ncbi:MAG: glycoside hydrolase family 3 protein [Thiomargarita sp.]|nr:glycoside hydrolase family 3 protein [Thiomargarita sp.]
MKYFLISAYLLFCLVWSFHLKNPHLLFLRDLEVLLLISQFLIIIYFSQKTVQNRPFKYSFLLSAILLLVMVFVHEVRFQWFKYQTTNNASDYQKKINQRLIIGYRDFEDLQKLVLNDIAGIFVTKRNIEGKSHEQVKMELAHLQNIRLKAGLKPLIVATDQEGGLVSRLSPLILKQPPLSSLVVEKNASKKSYQYGYVQGKQLKELGINVNFSPVVDLKPSKEIGALDFHSLIHKRAISDDPEIVSQIALSYIQGLEDSGVTATLKHFPGLSKVDSDTHHFSAQLNTPISELKQNDWYPFQTITEKTNAWIMLAHIVLPEIDPIPVSTSKKVVDEIIRKQLRFHGILITDDLTMGATYNRGFCKSSRNALAADINYLLIAYDYEKYFSLMMCMVNGEL